MRAFPWCSYTTTSYATVSLSCAPVLPLYTPGLNHIPMGDICCWFHTLYPDATLSMAHRSNTLGPNVQPTLTPADSSNTKGSENKKPRPLSAETSLTCIHTTQKQTHLVLSQKHKRQHQFIITASWYITGVSCLFVLFTASVLEVPYRHNSVNVLSTALLYHRDDS